MSNSLLDEEALESLVYERSKIWSNYMSHLEELQDEEVLTLDDLENLYEDDESMSDIEEAVEDGVVENITNTTMNRSRAELTMMLCSGDNQQEKAELEEIFNQTLPVLEEHERKFKAAGLDRILNTFDEQQIEEHVGGWLRRNNSIYIEKSPAKCQARPLNLASGSASEAESFHSVDTARYIRASRQCINAGQRHRQSSSTTSTKIKMFRTFQRKRDELREKYDCADFDYLEDHRHMQAQRQRREQQLRRHHLKMTNFHYLPRHYAYKPNSSSGRRKQLHKRRNISTICDLSSSDEECCGQLPLLAARYRRHRRQAVTYMPHQQTCNADRRPRLLECECRCFKKEALCEDVLHFVNTSTEDWLVENCDTPAKAKKRKIANLTTTSAVKLYRKKLDSIASDNSSDDDDSDRPKPTKKKILSTAADVKAGSAAERSKRQLKQDTKPAAAEQTIFFNNHSVAFNSTALANDTACIRTLTPAASASSTQQIIDLCSSSSASDVDAHPKLSKSCRKARRISDSDCSSMTVCEAAPATTATAAVSQKPPIKITDKGILLHAPNISGQDHSSSNITSVEQCLSSIIGQRKARKLLKVYGSRNFDSNYTVYYRPTPELAAALSGGQQVTDLNCSPSSSSSDDDIFDIRYGEVYAMLESPQARFAFSKR